MKTSFALAGLAFALLPTLALAAPVRHAKPAPKAAKTAALYECSKCHMRVSAAVAKKSHLKDPMDGGTFVPIKAAKK